MPDPSSLIDEWVEDPLALLRCDHRWQNLAEGLMGGERVTKGTVQERHNTTQVRAPYIDRDVAAALAYLKIAWGKQSVSDVIRDLIDHYKESLSKLSK